MSDFRSSSSSRFFPKENIQPRQNNFVDLTNSPPKNEDALASRAKRGRRSSNKEDQGDELVVTAPTSAEKEEGESSNREKRGRKSSPYFGKFKKGVAMKTPPVLKEPDTCAICLDTASNPAKLETCIHVFCFECIKQWAMIKLECPYCKKPFKEALCRDMENGRGYKKIEFDEPAMAEESDEEGEFGYFMEEGYDEDEDSDYDPQAAAAPHHGYESDDGFIVQSDDDFNEDSYEQEDSFQDDELQAAEAALEDRNRRNRRRRRQARARAAVDAAPVDLISPDPQGNREEAKDSPMDLVTPEEDDTGGSEGGPSDLISRFGFNK